MRRLARQVLHLLMVAVLLSAGSLNGYAAVLEAFHVHDHGGHGLHDHAADHEHTGNVLDVADATHDQDKDDPAAKGNLCAGVHVHCCCTYAVPAADLTLKLPHERTSVPAAASHIPHGQLASPLFRPPRAIA
ncbi:hypothetical protein [Hyphomicrobium sp.]|uniref:hypothetical protein n=1 Tax=Hyphomicrobium sp. TaxID=82 RepID=UPI0025BF8248|nr:hypothetical protein [Hyphomicrobium sp.]MCC7251875.1 hypothetical protein [Hyphomicrobium sp.]